MIRSLILALSITAGAFTIVLPAYAAADASQVVAQYGKLTQEEQQKFIKAVVPESKTIIPEATTVETLDKLASIGESVGKGLASAAKEMGVAANEFAKTDVGKLAAGLIVWNYFGRDFVSLAGAVMRDVVGFIMLFGAFPFYRAYLRTVTKSIITYSPDKTTWFGNPRVLSKTYGEPDPEYVIGATTIAIIVAIFGFAMIAINR